MDLLLRRKVVVVLYLHWAEYALLSWYQVVRAQAGHQVGQARVLAALRRFATTQILADNRRSFQIGLICCFLYSRRRAGGTRT